MFAILWHTLNEGSHYHYQCYDEVWDCFHGHTWRIKMPVTEKTNQKRVLQNTLSICKNTLHMKKCTLYLYKVNLLCSCKYTSQTLQSNCSLWSAHNWNCGKKEWKLIPSRNRICNVHVLWGFSRLFSPVLGLVCLQTPHIIHVVSSILFFFFSMFSFSCQEGRLSAFSWQEMPQMFFGQFVTVYVLEKKQSGYTVGSMLNSLVNLRAFTGLNFCTTKLLNTCTLLNIW